MTFLRWALPFAIAASLLTVAGSRAEPSRPANRIELRIEVYAFAGFHVLTNRTTIDASAGRYRITTEIDTRGIVSLFIDLNSRSESHGRIAGNAVLPEVYDSDVRRNGVDRRYRINYLPAGPMASEWAPPATGWQTPIPPEKLAGTAGSAHGVATVSSNAAIASGKTQRKQINAATAVGGGRIER